MEVLKLKEDGVIINNPELGKCYLIDGEYYMAEPELSKEECKGCDLFGLKAKNDCCTGYMACVYNGVIFKALDPLHADLLKVKEARNEGDKD
jgi:hypothetical protein